MSDITRWKVSGPTTRLQPDANGPWVTLFDHYRVIDRLIAERDAAQAEVERLKEQIGALTLAVEQADEMKAHAEAAATAEEAETDRVMAERDAAQAEVERLRANGQAILDSSRPDDETIWREAFMRFIEEKNAVECADIALAQYRKRWPR